MCQTALAFIYNAQEIDTAQKQHINAIEDRYKYYYEALAKEADGCVKPGFTDKLLKANDEHLLPLEQNAIARFADLQRQLDALILQMESP